MVNLVESSLEFWLTSGRWHERLEDELASWYGVSTARLVNSGSSANLLAVATLTSHLLGDRRLRPGDEVITVAAGFPTTVAPVIQLGMVPVFVDVTLPTYNLDVAKLEEARSPRTKAVMVAHTLGNPFDLDAVRAFCDKHQLWLVEDNCDAAGSLYRGQEDRHVRRPRDAQLLPAPPHDDGRGRRGDDERLDARAGDDVACATGGATAGARPASTTPAAPLRVAARRPAEGLRPQVRLQPPRLQPEDHRHAGGGRRRAAPAARRLRRGAPEELGVLPRRRSPTSPTCWSSPRRPRAPSPPGSASCSRSARARRSPATSSCATSSRRRSRPGCSSPGTSCGSPR